MQKILIVDDSPDTQLLIERTLGGLGFELFRADDSSTALAHASKRKLDLILLDIGLPDEDGLSVFQKIQATSLNSETPVIFLTGRDELATKVAAFSLGAEDYVVKPFNPIELRARIEMRLRKVRALADSKQQFRKGALRFELLTQRVYLTEGATETDLALTPLEFKLLSRLANQEGQAYSREQLLIEIWGRNVHVYDRTVDTHISSLRKKLGSHSYLVESVPGVGYRFSQSKSAA